MKISLLVCMESEIRSRLSSSFLPILKCANKYVNDQGSDKGYEAGYGYSGITGS